MKTMYLDTVKPKELNLFREPKQVNRTDDIRGATVPKMAYPYVNKPTYACRSDDITGAKPIVPKQFRSYRAIRNVNDVSDIDGTSSKPHYFSTKRVTNPLDPEYKLGSMTEGKRVVPETSLVEPKYLGERMMRVDDIEGTKPNPLYRWKQRDTMSTDDIVGSKAGWKPVWKRRTGPPRKIMDVSDIVSDGFKSSRVTDPLDPVHRIHGRELRIDERKSRPRPLPKRRNGPNLHQTRDIPGAYPGWFPSHKRTQRGQVRPTNRTDDIKGAQADTCNHGLKSKRRLDPNDPQYVGVDGTSLGTVKRPNTPPVENCAFFRDELDKKIESTSLSKMAAAKTKSVKRSGSSSTKTSSSSGRMRKSFSQKRIEAQVQEDIALVKSLN